MTGRERYVAALRDGHAELYWWHAAVCDDLDRIGALDIGGVKAPWYNVPGVASNLRMSPLDVETWARELIAAGVLVEAAPRWDMSPGRDTLWIQVPA